MFHERRWIGYALASPALLAAALILIVPVTLLLSAAFASGGQFSLSQFADFFADPLNLEIIWRTLKIASLVTLAAIGLGYGAALAITGMASSRRSALVNLVVLPLMISPVARTYAWIVILGRIGLLNGALQGLGLSDSPLRLLFTETAVFIGLLQLFLPYMILSLASALENLPRDMASAAAVLGANSVQTFAKVILPLTREGLAAGGIIVFTGSITAYITPAVLGGPKVLMLETLMAQRVNVTNDIAAASVIAVLLVAMSLGASEVLRRFATPAGERA